jgi:pectate lyase-like protein
VARAPPSVAKHDMDRIRREFLKTAGSGVAVLVSPTLLARGLRAQILLMSSNGAVFNVRTFGATGDGKTLDSPAINRAIEAAGAKGGTGYFPAGVYACFSLRLTSAVTLYVTRAPRSVRQTRRTRGSIGGRVSHARI